VQCNAVLCCRLGCAVAVRPGPSSSSSRSSSSSSSSGPWEAGHWSDTFLHAPSNTAAVAVLLQHGRRRLWLLVHGKGMPLAWHDSLIGCRYREIIPTFNVPPPWSMLLVQRHVHCALHCCSIDESCVQASRSRVWRGRECGRACVRACRSSSSSSSSSRSSILLMRACTDDCCLLACWLAVAVKTTHKRERWKYLSY